jgi:hypothetical protein
MRRNVSIGRRLRKRKG